MNYKKELLKVASEKEVEEWIIRNPMPKEWQGDKYSYAYTEMPIGSAFSFIRKNIFGWAI
jgi:hypothetical protein